jgi:hypothetical protein
MIDPLDGTVVDTATGAGLMESVPLETGGVITAEFGSLGTIEVHTR